MSEESERDGIFYVLAENAPTSSGCGGAAVVVIALEANVVKLAPRLLKVLLNQDGLSAEGTFEELRDR